MTTPTIQSLSQKKIIGIHMPMSLSENLTSVLWQKFMPRRHEIKNTVNKDLISMQIYAPNHFKEFDPSRQFTKWAAVEVSSEVETPEGMDTYAIPEGLYATFYYRGLSTDTSIFMYIFGTWLPQSNYLLDDRPHFEVLGEKYKNNDAGSEEEIWVPLIKKI